MIDKRLLLTPGPTPVPDRVALAGIGAIHHRTVEFETILEQVFSGLKYVFQTENDVLIFAASGTGAMEAAVANLLSPEDRAIVVGGGKFSERWVEILNRYQVRPIEVEVPWGEAVSTDQIETALRDHPDAEAVFTVFSETSTGTVTDLGAIGQVVADSEVVLVTDAVSGLLAMELRPDAWGVDVVVSGSQKGLMLPPGLGFVSVSAKAWRRVEKSELPRYYFDFSAYREKLPRQMPYTAPISLILQLHRSLEMIHDEGIERIWERHRVLAEAARAGVRALGLELLSRAPGNAVTAVKLPVGIDGKQFLQLLRDRYGVILTGGQKHLKGRIFRIAHLGYMNASDVIVGLSAIERGLKRLGHPVELGAAVAAAQRVFSEFEELSVSVSV
ncbi:MAG: pyridoxal-phosphate-dependent aminotransferase family protein [Candidatus Bipolaricaulia bacterium]